ncbi:MAG: 4-(cytidine 5'-diphospho)-2-C-methyl-D-erythritol kinase [Coriobacteriales bacterium]|nr:4-(cytidine 5'-diphospho)-2-C-methyl-D-erythritol kinase [Coriobacteriales bacterium]
METRTYAAPAKLNLHLGIYDVLDQRGYHKADSVMVALDLCDRVTVSVPHGDAEDGMPMVTCNPEVDVPAERNTVYRAAMALATAVGKVPAVRIEVQKIVPDQAGMGGSSSDAATTLRALCELWGVDPHDERVERAARSVGADVPFFLDPVPTYLVGAGDVVEQKYPRPPCPIPVVLVRPQGPGVSTQAAYAAFDECHDAPGDPGPLCKALYRGNADAAELAGLLFNNLDPIACRLLPAVGEVRAWLLGQDGVLGGQVTGSGSCVFGICHTHDEAARIAALARSRFGGWAQAAHIV